MKYKILVLNYDSEWVTYAKSPSQWFNQIVIEDLHHHGFGDYQIKIVEL